MPEYIWQNSLFLGELDIFDWTVGSVNETSHSVWVSDVYLDSKLINAAYLVSSESGILGQAKTNQAWLESWIKLYQAGANLSSSLQLIPDSQLIYVSEDFHDFYKCANDGVYWCFKNILVPDFFINKSFHQIH